MAPCCSACPRCRRALFMGACCLQKPRSLRLLDKGTAVDKLQAALRGLQVSGRENLGKS